MKKDLYDLAVTTDSTEVIDALNLFHEQLIMSGKEGGKVLDAAKAHPESCLLQCYAAALLLFAQDSKLDAKALRYLDRAEALLREVSERERLIFHAIKAWHQVDYELGLALLTDITTQWPTDCTSAKMAEWLYYCSGQAYNAGPFLAMCEAMYPHCKSNPGFLATHSFALELSGRYQEAMDMALYALDLNPVTPWAHHTVGHVTLYTSKIDEGISLFNQYAPTWELILPPLRGHLYWHCALYPIAKRDEAAANAFYEGGMWGTSPDTVLEQIDAISYLWRMEMAGMAQDKKLQELAAHIGYHPFEFYLPFANAHYMYVLSRTGNRAGVQKMLDRVVEHAGKLTGAERHLWKEITLPLLKGCAAFGQGEYRAAADYFTPIMGSITQVGGSDAQERALLPSLPRQSAQSGPYEKWEASFARTWPRYPDGSRRLLAEFSYQVILKKNWSSMKQTTRVKQMTGIGKRLNLRARL